MALVVKDRVQVTTTTTGTGTVTLGSAVTGFQDFSVIGDGNTTYYAITSGNDWEVGLGTYTASGTTLSRDTILESSNSGSAITLSGTSNVFCTYPAEKAIYTDANDVLNTTEINLSTLKLNGSTSGTITLQSPAVAGTNTLTIPAVTGNILTDGAALPAIDGSALTNLPAPSALSTASGSAPSYSARAWINMNGTGTVAIRDSGNVSSITDNGTGSYTVNFTTAMSDTNYCGICNGSVINNDLNSWHGGVVNRTTSSFRIDVENLSDAGQRDPDTIYAVIFQ
jgi:hypothetical protein